MAKRNTHRPGPIVASRIARCRRRMKKHKLSAFLLTSPADYFYLTGFTGEDSAVVLTPKDVHVISDSRFDQTLGQECPWATRWMRKQQLTDEIGTVCKSLKLKTLAVQPAHMTLSEHATLTKRARGTRLAQAPNIIGDMRCLKDDTELRIMRKAIRIAEEAFLTMRASIRVGQTEREMAARLEYEMQKRGATGAAFPTICAEGKNAALPHAKPGRRKVRKGSAILFDWGARWGGYCSDLTRMVFVGSIPDPMGEVYAVVLEAQRRAIADIRPGRRMCDVDAVARDAIADAGYGDKFGHGLGHGLGLDVHEAPSLSWRCSDKLKAGMLVTVEPGIYLPGVGGVRIEDDVLVTPGGRRVLSRLDKTLEGSVI